ncbi:MULTISPECIES: hypothetical protein [Stappiaceae]|nr:MULTISPECIES: hypothetical protein [Stappiaceae]
MFAVFGDTTFLAWSLPLLAAALLFGVYFGVKLENRKNPSDQ